MFRLFSAVLFPQQTAKVLCGVSGESIIRIAMVVPTAISNNRIAATQPVVPIFDPDGLPPR
jgi:hypothetical protein